jgi:uncharacterized protein
MMGNTRIRDLTEPDRAGFLCINADSAPAVSRLDSIAATALLSAADIAWVAEIDGRLAGYLVGFLSTSNYDGEEFSWFKKSRNGFVYVDQIAIASPFRGHGIGRHLYTELFRWSLDNTCSTVVCEVNLQPPNPASLAFHERCGFSRVGQLAVSDGREVALLECLIPPS